MTDFIARLGFPWAFDQVREAPPLQPAFPKLLCQRLAAPVNFGEKAEEKTVKNQNGLVLAAVLEEKEISFRVWLSVSRNIHVYVVDGLLRI